MSDQNPPAGPDGRATPAKRRVGNPNWIAGGASPNPKGRPRRGDALAEAIRDRVSPDELIAVAQAIIAGDAAPSVKLQAAEFLASRGYSRPADKLEVGPIGAADDAEDQAVLDALSLDELRELERLDAERDAIIGRATARQLPAPKDGDE